MKREIAPREVSMGSFSTKTMADLFVAAAAEWERRALREVMPDFHDWCVQSGLLGTSPWQFQPVLAEGTADAGFASGACVTFVDGSVAVRDLDELRRGRLADWRALQRLAEELARRMDGDS